MKEKENSIEEKMLHVKATIEILIEKFAELEFEIISGGTYSYNAKNDTYTKNK